MKSSLIVTGLLLFSKLASASQVVLSPLDHLYVPAGYDSNDAVEVVVTGAFPNPCYSRNQVEVRVKDALIDIRVTSLAPASGPKSASIVCPQMIVPFKEVVSIGNLQGGKYLVRVNAQGRNKLLDTLTVAEASSSAIDDHVYSAIEWVEQKGANQFVLHGVRYSPCFELADIKAVSNGKDTVSLLPIMRQVSDFCPMKGMPVSYPVRLDFSSLKTRRPLLHVRTLDGKSVNSIVNFGSR